MPPSPADRADRINILLDTLTIELLDLVEQQVRCQLAIEDAVVNGQLLVAKTRYTLGKNAVTIAQLPTENSTEFESLVTVQPAAVASSSLSDDSVSLELNRRPADKEAGRPDPLNWFGILLPQSMQGAQRMFTLAVERSVECANIRLGLQTVMQSILNVRSRVLAASA